MKTQSVRRKNGFTLVELLVVITIIAVLAGVGFQAGASAIQKANKITALVTCTAIETAVNNFYTEYGTMPKDNMTADTVINTKTDLDFLKVLMGKETGTTPLNTRSINFLNVKEGKANKNGLIYSADGKTVTGLYDPWGGAFYVMLDGDYDEVLKDVQPAGASAKTLNGRRVAAWSNGADAISGSGGKATDNVITWNK